MRTTRRVRPIAFVVLELALALDPVDLPVGWTARPACLSRLPGWTARPACLSPLPVPQEDAETAVRDSLQRYAAALESLDAGAVKKIQPSIAADTLARASRDMRELKVVIDAVRVISLDDAAARVSCKVTQTLTPRVGSTRTTEVTRVVRMRREANGWVIDAFER
jgi:hypothetical protein